MKQALTGGVAVIALLAVVLFAARRNNDVLAEGLPPRVECSSKAEAIAAAVSEAKATGQIYSSVLGTGSMAPYIPAAPKGQQPTETVVAIAVLGGSYTQLVRGDLCVYRAEWSPTMSVIHVAAQKDSAGWIMSGLHNSRSEPHWRVTQQNFIGIVSRVYVWPLDSHN